jgi:hypothetical protein
MQAAGGAAKGGRHVCHRSAYRRIGVMAGALAAWFLFSSLMLG